MAAVQVGSREFLYVQQQRMSFDQASAWCRNEGGELASIRCAPAVEARKAPSA